MNGGPMDLSSELQQLIARTRAEHECDIRVLSAMAKWASATNRARHELARDMEAIFAPVLPSPPPIPVHTAEETVSDEWQRYRMDAGK